MEHFLSKNIIKGLELLSQNLEFEGNSTKPFYLKRTQVTKDIDYLYLETNLMGMIAKSFLVFNDTLHKRKDCEIMLLHWDILALTFSIIPTDKVLNDLPDVEFFLWVIRFFPDIPHTWEFEEDHFVYLESVVSNLIQKIFKNDVIREAGISFLRKDVRILYSQDGFLSEFPESAEVIQLV